MANPETIIANSILCDISGPDCLAWKQVTGKFRAMGNPKIIVSTGIPGMADIISVRAVTITQEMVGRTVGVCVAHEVKTLTGRQREAQKSWQTALERAGGIYLLSRSVEQARDQAESVPRIICER